MGSLLMRQTRLYRNCFVMLWERYDKTQLTINLKNWVSRVINYLENNCHSEDPNNHVRIFTAKNLREIAAIEHAATYWCGNCPIL
jgi:hypothetical protein